MVKLKLNVTHEELAKEWHPRKNGNLKPTDVTYGSNRNIWWKCLKNETHEWETKIWNRTQGKECPHCSKEKRKKRK